MTCKEAINEVLSLHYPCPPATVDEIRRFEEKSGVEISPELRAFYLHCDGAKLFDKEDPPYQILSLEAVERTRVAIFGTDEEGYGPPSWYAICDVRDGNYVSVDLDPNSATRFALFDSFHETFHQPGSREMIASSFCDFLADALRSGGRLYWLRDA